MRLANQFRKKKLVKETKLAIHAGLWVFGHFFLQVGLQDLNKSHLILTLKRNSVEDDTC